MIHGKSSPWSDAVLVTPRHAVRNRWNEQQKPLDRNLQILVQSRMFPTEDGKASKGDPGGNIETELDVANGARGVVEQIIVDEAIGEVEGAPPHVRRLTRPPICVLVRLDRTKAKALPGLEEGVIPIAPIRSRFQVELPNSQKLTLWREQLPLTPAYSFTDYRSQGQTIPSVIIDLATPPSGGLTPFNAYVALSRSRTTQQARLLRGFDPKLFTTPPDEHLMEEDARLERLLYHS